MEPILLRNAIRGRDIRAACGQLIVEGEKRSPGQLLATVAFAKGDG